MASNSWRSNFIPNLSCRFPADTFFLLFCAWLIPDAAKRKKSHSTITWPAWILSAEEYRDKTDAAADKNEVRKKDDHSIIVRFSHFTDYAISFARTNFRPEINACVHGF